MAPRPWIYGQYHAKAIQADPTSSEGFINLIPHLSFPRKVGPFKVPLTSICSNESFGEKQEDGRVWRTHQKAGCGPGLPLTHSGSWSLSPPPRGLSFPSCTARGQGWTFCCALEGASCVSSF